MRPDLSYSSEESLRHGGCTQRRARLGHGLNGVAVTGTGQGHSTHRAKVSPSSSHWYFYIWEYFLRHLLFHLFSPFSNFNYLLYPFALCVFQEVSSNLFGR